MANSAHFTDGHGIRVSLVTQALVAYEKDVTPGGTAGGDPIETTTNDNTSQTTMSPQSLTSPKQIQSTLTYNEADLAAWEAAVNVPDTMLVKWPDDTTRQIPGFLLDVEAGQATKGEQPTLAIIFQPRGEAPTP